MIDEAGEQREEELAERDRIGEKSPSADAAFGGREGGGPPSPLPRGLYQWLALPVPRPRPWTLRENVAAALAYLRKRR